MISTSSHAAGQPCWKGALPSKAVFLPFWPNAEGSKRFSGSCGVHLGQKFVSSTTSVLPQVVQLYSTAGGTSRVATSPARWDQAAAVSLLRGAFPYPHSPFYPPAPSSHRRSCRVASSSIWNRMGPGVTTRSSAVPLCANTSRYLNAVCPPVQQAQPTTPYPPGAPSNTIVVNTHPCTHKVVRTHPIPEPPRPRVWGMAKITTKLPWATTVEYAGMTHAAHHTPHPAHHPPVTFTPHTDSCWLDLQPCTGVRSGLPVPSRIWQC